MSNDVTVAKLAQQVGADLVGGDDQRIVDAAATLESAGPSHVAFLANRKYASKLTDTRAGAVIIGRDLESLDVPNGTALLRVDDAYLGLAKALEVLYPAAQRRPGVSPTAVIEENVELGRDVEVEPFAVIRTGARIGDRVKIGAHSVVGAGCEVGPDSEVREHVSLFAGTSVGARCTIHSGARLGADGYGYVYDGTKHRKVLQVGRCVIEDDVEIGANTTIDRGSIGETRVGAGTKVDNLVHIAHNVSIGRNCLIVAQVGIAGSTRLGNGVALAGQVGVIDHLTIGDGARVAAQAGVSHDIPAGETWFGYPARPLGQVMRANATFLKLPELVQRIRQLEKQVGSDSA